MAEKQGATCPLNKKTSIGGQALLEGVMMRGPQKTAMAVRNPAGEIVLEESDNPVNTRPQWTKWPVVRGIFNFVDSMIYGYKCLMRSAEISGLEDALNDEPTADAVADNDDDGEKIENGEKTEKKDNGLLMTGIMVVSTVLGVGLALVLFKLIPEAVYEWLGRLFPAITGKGYGASVLRAALTGVMKILILVGYMAMVSLMKDIRRTFQYHGAEHKSIFCYEQGLELTVENVRAQRRFHPRCGTSFLILMVLVSVFVMMFIPAQLVAGKIWNILARTGISLLLLPLIVGLGYELIKLAGRKDTTFTRIISAPGVWLQHITTREPDDSMIECAITALKAVIPEDPEADRW